MQWHLRAQNCIFILAVGCTEFAFRCAVQLAPVAPSMPLRSALSPLLLFSNVSLAQCTPCTFVSAQLVHWYTLKTTLKILLCNCALLLLCLSLVRPVTYSTYRMFFLFSCWRETVSPSSLWIRISATSKCSCPLEPAISLCTVYLPRMFAWFA